MRIYQKSTHVWTKMGGEPAKLLNMDHVSIKKT